jgi:hypothetical protein
LISYCGDAEQLYRFRLALLSGCTACDLGLPADCYPAAFAMLITFYRYMPVSLLRASTCVVGWIDFMPGNGQRQFASIS